MKYTKLTYFLLLLLVVSACKKGNDSTVTTETHTDPNGFTYETVTNDPTGLRLYTLDNGLKVYLSRNTDEPKIQTFIPVRAGSVYDPADNTGLAHYLEHMVFKGTDEIGTQDWEKEKVLLQEISDLYEAHKKETDSVKKRAIYRKIDSVSQEASKISIANEYDKMVSSLGAEGTNAWTWNEETVYVNKIPSNGLDKWLRLESERFSQLVLRLFHTELEAVYEEFNRAQDSDSRKEYYELFRLLFPKHPYGQQPTIGVSEHLKNPSMEAIHDYFNTYYVPNNMAVVLVGDLEFDETIKKVNDAFGDFKPKEVTYPERPKEDSITAPVENEVFGPEAARVSLAYRTPGIGTEGEKYITLIDMILNNSEAGLIDLNLNQQQKLQRAGCSPTFQNDYGYHRFYGYPKSDQSLEEVKELLLGQIEKVKKGEFDEWMLDAVINDLKLSQIRQYENASAVAYAYVNAFVHFQDWGEEVKKLDELRKISKQELVNYANEFYKDNYAVVYKRQGEAKNLVKVENPKITPIQLNRDKQSEFIQAFNEIEIPNLKPQHIDYEEAIKETKTNAGLEVSYIENEINDLAELNIIFDMGKDNDKKLEHAIGYMEYMGTDKYAPDELKKEFYKLGVNYGVRTGNDRSYVYVSGLSENLDKGLALLEHLWSNAVADQETYDKYVQNIGKRREDTKASKSRILWSGLMSYGQYGENSRLRDIFTIEELKAIDPQELVDIFKDLKNYKQRIFYYGNDLEGAVAALDEKHNIQEELVEYPENKVYLEKETGGHVYFVDYDMVQSEMLFLAKGETFDPKKMAASSLFNTYFGSGLSSIVFQEIRESKSLAYSAFAAYSNASEERKPNYTYAYIGTQANKMPQAVEAMMELMTNMPEAQEQFEAAKESTLKKLAADRINRQRIFWQYESLKKRGLTEDNRQAMYDEIKKMTFEDLQTFFNENIKGETYDVMVVGNKNDVDMEALKKLGEVEEIDLDYLFNYEKPKPLKP
ncbi:insulinase family protein [Galbibacter sp. EGI 63066]|uniref:M16 family metallopeptidase n=1 Tax=Galbibacter sp. EGI 63066 TaxID=2993559 RepID=UPI00224980EC|nr:M16 family metallopeptidase [Galbibacter sp. EGI 63066]MCX2680783.1 insulinase family protein [Galbibacter sp. EGI 63066]